MTLNGEVWHDLIVKTLSALKRRITSKHQGGFYCLNCLHSIATENNRECLKKYVRIKILNFIVPSENTKILEFNQYQKSD